MHPPPVITGEDGRGAWLRNYNDCVRVQVAAGQFGYGNSGADCLFIGCPRVSTLLDDIHRFLLISLPANDFSIFSIFRYLFPFSFFFFFFNGIDTFIYKIRQIILIDGEKSIIIWYARYFFSGRYVGGFEIKFVIKCNISWNDSQCPFPAVGLKH